MAQLNSLKFILRTYILSFVILSFQQFDNPILRKECIPLVSIDIWLNLSSEETRKSRILLYPHLRKLWKASVKRFNASVNEHVSKTIFTSNWLFNIIIDFINILYNKKDKEHKITYCEKVLELLVDLVTQPLSRRYLNFLLKDFHFTTLVKRSPFYMIQENRIFRDFFEILDKYIYIGYDDHNSMELSLDDITKANYNEIVNLQRIAMRNFKEKLIILATSNYATINTGDTLIEHLESLDDNEFYQLFQYIGLRSQYPKELLAPINREFLTYALIEYYKKRESLQEALEKFIIIPDEYHFYKKYDGFRSLPLLKFNLQYLSISDFIYRSLELYRDMVYDEIRKDIENVISKMKPKVQYPSFSIRFQGSSNMALVIKHLAILEVARPKVGEEKPGFVRAEVKLELDYIPEELRRHWESLRQGDIVYLLSIKPTDDLEETAEMNASFALKSGLRYLRTAEVDQILNHDGRPLKVIERLAQEDEFEMVKMGRKRILRLFIDTRNYKIDNDQVLYNEGDDVYSGINVIVRRSQKDNNFKPILESLKNLAKTSISLPPWFEDIFLGFGDPSNALYYNLETCPHSLSFVDTFLDWTHLLESFPNKDATPNPPYRIYRKYPQSLNNSQVLNNESENTNEDSLFVETYSLPNFGPYPENQRKVNNIRFTPKQAEAIYSGTNPGLTLINGAPGTGKTDIVVQIINNIYHNFPDQRTLLIAQSSQTLIRVLEKLSSLNIPQRHILRLGHDDGLENEFSFYRSGRIDLLLERRTKLLQEVDRLASTLQMPGAHGNSCETAGYFFNFHIKPLWTEFLSYFKNQDSIKDIILSFPFQQYFSTAPNPLFTENLDKNQVLDIASGCYHHIEELFSELSDIRPFEFLHSNEARSNYLLSKAKIIAMTSNYTLIKREKIFNLNLKYDNLIYKNSNQLFEIGTFVPMTFQTDFNYLKRIVLLGDSKQMGPIVKNNAFKYFSNIKQSFYIRLMRLGVPIIHLDAQGRTKSTIAELFSWAYDKLTNLPNLEKEKEFLHSNAGTKNLGYLKELDRLIVAVSRARLGLYILGRRNIFESCFELQSITSKLFKNPEKLQLVSGEMWPSNRKIGDKAENIFEMEGVEHLGVYVYEMSKKALEKLKENKNVS
ncbi:hypothetical protein PCANB_001555 [Pneumocystis canis]|nr:hypothetical protein PCANB_001555 [Pneumocystis canis]